MSVCVLVSELRSMSYFALVQGAEFRALLAKMSKSRPGGESAYNNGVAEKENKICKCSNLLGWKYRDGIFCTEKNYRSRC